MKLRSPEKLDNHERNRFESVSFPSDSSFSLTPPVIKNYTSESSYQLERDLIDVKSTRCRVVYERQMSFDGFAALFAHRFPSPFRFPMMRIYHHRLQTPFRTHTTEIFDKNCDTMMKSGEKTTQNAPASNELYNYEGTTGLGQVPPKIKSDSVEVLAGDTPEIALTTSSSSSSSDSSTPSANKMESKPLQARSDAFRTRQAHVGPYWYTSFYNSQQHAHGHHRGAHVSYARGMVPASPGPPTTPPTTAAHRTSRSSGRAAIGAPPQLYRVTTSSMRDAMSRLCFCPFAADRRYSDQMMQQMEEQRRRLTYALHPNYRCSPTLPYPYHHQHQMPVAPEPYVLSGYRCAPEVIGHPSLQIYKLSLPFEHLHLLDQIVEGCEAYAQTRSTGWQTNLYSLTEQDIALMDVPNLMKIAMPIMEYLSRCICEIFHASAIKVDRNQPHVLKYTREHTGVELHHDRCDVTANLMLSRSHTYVGGGTYFPDADHRIVRLKFGEFLLHPGQLVHSGNDISAGTRYLMVLFADLE